MSAAKRARATAILLVAAILAGCSSVAIPPTYAQDELKAECDRHRGWWRPDDLAVGIVIFADLDEQGHHPSARRPSPSLGMRLTRAGATAPVPPEVSAVFQAHWRY